MGDPISTKKFLEVQVGGSGRGPWTKLGYVGTDGKSATVVDAPDPGTREVSGVKMRTTGSGHNLRNVALVRTGDPALVSVTVNLPDFMLNAWRSSIFGRFNLRVREYTGVDVKTNYVSMKTFVGALSESAGNGGFSAAIMDDNANTADMQKRSIPIKAIALDEVRQLDFSDISVASNLGNKTINRVYSFGVPAEAGVNGDTANNDGKSDFVVLTNNTGVGTVPLLYVTRNAGVTWTQVDITGATNGNAVAMTIAGGYCFVACTSTGGGLYRALWSDVLADTATWTLCTGITAGDVTNDVLAVDDFTIYTCEDTGIIMRSVDGGFNFSVFDNGVLTTDNLKRIVSYGRGLVWIGGVSGTLIKIVNDVTKTTVSTGVGSTINAMAIPPGSARTTELYLGHANGTLTRTLDGTTFANVPFDGDNTGSINAITFTGNDGENLWVLQENGSAETRLLLDHSGGYMRQDVQLIRAYASPSIKSICRPVMGASLAYDYIMVGGAALSSQAFVGVVSQNPVA